MRRVNHHQVSVGVADMAWDYESTKDGYENMWNEAEILPDKHAELEGIVATILKSEGRYKEVELETGVPWFWVGAIHMRESNCDFSTHLHNGDPLTSRTTHVPSGRPPTGEPPFSWEESAMDALAYQDLIHIAPWDCAMLHLQSELYNGTGYANKGINSPYVWSFTNHQQPGKYTSDGNFDPDAWDKQPGTSAIWLKMCETRPDIARHFRTEEVPIDDLVDVLTVRITINTPRGVKVVLIEETEG
jgi:lysozyme family protein